MELPELEGPCLDGGYGDGEGQKPPVDPDADPVELVAGAFQATGWSKEESRIHAIDCLAVSIRAYEARKAPPAGGPPPEGTVVCADNLYCIVYFVRVQWCVEGEPRFSRRYFAKNCWEGIKENCAADNPLSCSGSEEEFITFPSSTCLGIEGCFIVSDLGQSTKVVCCNGASSIVYCSCFPDELCEGGEWATQCGEPDQTCDCCEDE